MGVVTDVVKRKVPASYAALIGATNNSYGYGITDLYQISNLQQFKLFGTFTDISSESTVYDPIEVQLLGVLTTLGFIPAAVDYWGDQIVSQNLQGTSESNSFLDRRKDLWNIFEQLVKEASDLAQSAGISLTAAIIPKVSYGDNGRNILITPDPECFPRQISRRSLYDLGVWAPVND